MTAALQAPLRDDREYSNTMEKYRLVQEHKGDGEEFLVDSTTNSEVRITQQGKPRNYISYAMSLFVSTSTVASWRIRLLLLHMCQRAVTS